MLLSFNTFCLPKEAKNPGKCIFKYFKNSRLGNCNSEYSNMLEKPQIMIITAFTYPSGFEFAALLCLMVEYFI